MVCRLVQQQNIRLLEQQLGQRDAHLPAARELLGPAFPVLFSESQAIEHGPHLRLDRIPVVSTKLAIEPVKTICHTAVFFARGIEIAPFDASVSPIPAPISRRFAKTAMHSAKTLRPESVNPSCGRYPADMPFSR